MCWVSVKERMPIVKELTKFRVKIRQGSIQPKVVESHVLARAWHDTTRFQVGDWQKVTHWFEEESS